MSSSAATVVLIPVKSFARAKLRLAPVLDPVQRAGLAQAMAAQVVRAAAPLAVWCVCDDPQVRDWAHSVGAEVEWTPDLGLNGAVSTAVRRRAAAGARRVVVAHGDLPFAASLPDLADAADDEVLAVMDRHGRGTNVLSVPTDVEFAFSYGEGSFELHSAEAARRGLRFRVVDLEHLQWDVDCPADLSPPARLGPLPFAIGTVP
ncbi:MAG: 2-phospho-L-lactate guanylyltransferase [Microthrixaceae bacterium]